MPPSKRPWRSSSIPRQWRIFEPHVRKPPAGTSSKGSTRSGRFDLVGDRAVPPPRDGERRPSDRAQAARGRGRSGDRVPHRSAAGKPAPSRSAAPPRTRRRSQRTARGIPHHLRDRRRPPRGHRAMRRAFAPMSTVHVEHDSGGSPGTATRYRLGGAPQAVGLPVVPAGEGGHDGRSPWSLVSTGCDTLPQ